MNRISKYNHKPTFNNFFSDFFGEVPVNGKSIRQHMPATNIHQKEEAYFIDVIAPGRKKEDFELNVEENKLTLVCQTEEKVEQNETRFTLREYTPMSFKRSFSLPKRADLENISASYEAGILSIKISKLNKQNELRKVEIQ